MDFKRRADELTHRCVALMVFYQLARETQPDDLTIGAEFRAIAAEARKVGVSPADIAFKALTELHDRYGPEGARRLHRDFLAGFSEDIRIDLVTA
jgi:hypothetical protein